MRRLLNRFQTLFFLLMMTLALCPLSSSPSIAQSDFEATTKLHDELTSSLKDFNLKWASELDKLPRPKKTPKGSYIGKEAEQLANEGAGAFDEANLAEAEEKLTASLALDENQHHRQLLTLVLIAEKKYLEALPSSVDSALEPHVKDPNGHPEGRPEYDSISHLMLAHVLAQVGDIHTATIAYNFARKWVEDELQRIIARIPEEKRQKEMEIDLRYSYPLPPMEIDPDKADRKTLIEANRILFIKARGLYSGAKGRGRLMYQMIEAAYEDNPGGAITNFYKGFIVSVPLENHGLKGRVTSARDCQAYYQKAAEIAGAKSDLGKIALRVLKQAREVEITSQKTYNQAVIDGYDGD